MSENKGDLVRVIMGAKLASVRCDGLTSKEHVRLELTDCTTEGLERPEPRSIVVGKMKLEITLHAELTRLFGSLARKDEAIRVIVEIDPTRAS